MSYKLWCRRSGSCPSTSRTPISVSQSHRRFLWFSYQNWPLAAQSATLCVLSLPQGIQKVCGCDPCTFPVPVRLLAHMARLRLRGNMEKSFLLPSQTTSILAVVPLDLLSLLPLQRWLNSFHLDVRWQRCRRLRVSRQAALALNPWSGQAYMLKGVPVGSVPSGSVGGEGANINVLEM